MIKLNTGDIRGAIRKGARKAGSQAHKIAVNGVADSKFFKRNFFAVSFAVIVCIAYIAARFDHDATETTIRTLRHKIEVERTYMNQEVSRYHTLTRESAMQHLVDSLNLGLDVPEATPEARAADLILEP